MAAQALLAAGRGDRAAGVCRRDSFAAQRTCPARLPARLRGPHLRDPCPAARDRIQGAGAGAPVWATILLDGLSADAGGRLRLSRFEPQWPILLAANSPA